MKTIKVIFPLLCLFVCFSNLTNCGIKPTVQASTVNPEDLEDEIAEKKKKIKELDKDLEDLKEDIDDLEDKEDDLEDEEEELDEREEELEERIRELERTPDGQRQRELAEKRAELEQVKARRDQINTELTNIRNQINTKTAKVVSLSKEKLTAIVREAEAEKKLAEAHKKLAVEVYENAKELVLQAEGLSATGLSSDILAHRTNARSALNDAEAHKDDAVTKAGEAVTAYNDANTAKNSIDDDSTLAQIESAIRTAETKRDLAETKAGEVEQAYEDTDDDADIAKTKAKAFITGVNTRVRSERDTAIQERDNARQQTETQAISALQSATGTTLRALGAGCPSNNWNDPNTATVLTGTLSRLKFKNLVFDKTSSPAKGSNNPTQDIIHKLDFSSASSITIWIKESVMSYFASTTYKWYLYAENGGESPKVEFDPSSVTADGGFYKFTKTYSRNPFFDSYGNGFGRASDLNERGMGYVFIFAIGKTGECWSVTK